MTGARSTTWAPGSAADGLAAAARPAFGRAMAGVLQDPAAKIQRARERLYVLCQTGGWSFFLLVQFVFASLFMSSAEKSQSMVFLSLLRVVATGLLITHFARPRMRGWGWKELGWRPLLPRVLGMAILMSTVWCVVGYVFDHLVLGSARASNYPLWILFLTSLINGSMVMAGWLGIYFFYALFERLQRLQLDQLSLAANAKEMELRALKSQVNPHFLFNSLNSLRALIDEDPPRAREAVTRMANLLRYSLQSGQQETVTLDDELRTVEDYLALEQIRHEQRLRVRWEIADELRARPLAVPPMLLQTLVENAVKYGIGARREGGEIVVAAATRDGFLSINVRNPGELGPGPSGGASTGVGLRNASERLKLLYGDRASLSLRGEPAGFVTAGVLIPLAPAAP